MLDRQRFSRRCAFVSLTLLAAAVVGGWLTRARLEAQVAPPSFERWGGAIETASLPPGGQDPQGWGDSCSPERQRLSTSADGRYVAFASIVSNLVDGDNNSRADIFVRDLTAGTTTRVSVGPDGAESGAESCLPAISADGRYVAFVTTEAFFPGDGYYRKVYVRDIQAGTTTLISKDPAGILDLLDNDSPAISADGRFVAFTSGWPPQQYGAPPRDIYLCDRDVDGDGVFDPGTYAFTQVTMGNADSRRPSISADGRIVAFDSDATNLDPRGSGGIFAYDRLTHGITMASVAITGGPPNGLARDGAISADGRYVTFSSIATNLVADDTNAVEDVFVFELATGLTRRVSVLTGGAQLCNPPIMPREWAEARTPSISADGRYVAFSSSCPADFYSQDPSQIYVHDVQTAITTQVSQAVLPSWDSPRKAANQASWLPAISADGRHVAFLSYATDLNESTWRTRADCFVAHQLTAAPEQVTIPAGGGSATISVDTAPSASWLFVSTADGWFQIADAAMQGPGTLRATADANYGGERTGSVQIGPRVVTVTQAASTVTVDRITPSEGAVSGGTVVTISGSGFQPGLGVRFGETWATSAVVDDAATVRVTAPPHHAGWVDVMVQNPDGTATVTFWGFRYRDGTPPIVEPLVSGTGGTNGWYRGPVTLTWAVSDPDSAIWSMAGCSTVQRQYDGPMTSYTCTAQSEGGETSRTVAFGIDNYAPNVVFGGPYARVYPPGSSQTANYSCSDTSGRSGVATCSGPVPTGAPFDTSTSGFHVFTVNTSDVAGNQGTGSIRYGVSTGQCAAPPGGMVGWWGGDGFADWAGTNDVRPGASFIGNGLGYVGTAFDSANTFQPGSPALIGDSTTLKMTSAMTVAGWVNITDYGQEGVFFGREGEYLVGYDGNYRLRWSFANTNPGWGWVSVGPYLTYAYSGWIHVAVTYDQGVIKTYLNGDLVHTHQGAGDIGDVAPDMNEFWIGRRQDPGQPMQFDGWTDEVHLFNRALTQGEIETIVLGGDRGACRLPSPVVSTWARGEYNGTVAITGWLTDTGGQALAGRTIEFYIQGTQRGTGVTDSMGHVEINVPISGLELGTYADAVAAKFAGDSQFTRAVAYGSLEIAKANPQVTWSPPDLVYPSPVGAAQLGATANVPGVFNYSIAIGDVLPAGYHTVDCTFVPDDAVHYNTVTVHSGFVVRRANPVLTWPTPSDIIYGTTLGPTQLNATADVPGTFSYTPPAGTVLNAGTGQTLRVTFTPTDSASYWPRTATVTINVAKAVPELWWPTPADISYGVPLTAMQQLNARATVPGTYVYTPPAGTVLNAGDGQTLSVTFTPTYQTNYTTSTKTVAINVMKAPTYITWAAPADIVYGTVLGAAQLNATANVPGTFTYAPPAGTVLTAGPGQALTATFTPTDGTNYTPTTKTVAITVNKAATQITWPAPADIVYGVPLGSAQLNATAGVPGAFSYNPPAGTVLNAGPGQPLTATFTPTDAANYTPATATVAINVGKAATQITWPVPGDIVYATPLGAAQLNATASVPGTLSYNPPAGTVLNAGAGQTLSATFAPADAVNYSPSTATVPINVAKAQTRITWAPPAGIVYGTALGASQLNATAGVPGTFTYDPPAGTVLNAGAGQTLRVAFTPTDSTNYVPATATVTIDVTRATTQLAWASPAAIAYGTALGAAQLNATANAPGTFTYSPPAGSVLNAGAGQVLTVAFTPADSVNYSPATASVAIDVTRRSLVIQAVDATKPFGAPLPVPSVTVSGFVAGDSLASLAGALTYATTATQASPAGDYAVTPGGVSSPNYAITFLPGTLHVVRAATIVALESSGNPSGLNQGVMVTAVVSVVAPGAGSPGGMVQFLDGPTLLGTATMFGGSASIMINGLSAGSHALTATYSGDSGFLGGVAALTQTVNASDSTTTTTVIASVNPSVVGRSVTFTATVTMPSGGVSGSVEFYDGAALLGVAAVSSGRATLATAALGEGSHAITARYTGNGSTPPSVSPVFVQSVATGGVKLRSSTCALNGSVSGTLGQDVVLLGSVIGGANRMPTGEVQFTFDGALPGSTTRIAVEPVSGVTAQGQLQVAWLTRGTHRIEVTYLGDGTFRGCTASSTLTVN